MDTKVKDALSDSIRGFRLPRYRELPDMGFYLDQVTKYINQNTVSLGFGELTGSMIRNYVKQGLVDNPVNKQYSANQIAHLIVITILKQVISLEHISSFFSLQQKVYSDETAYNYFCDELENILYHRFGLKPEFSDKGALIRIAHCYAEAQANDLKLWYWKSTPTPVLSLSPPPPCAASMPRPAA